MRTVPQLPGHAVAAGLAVAQQRGGVAAVPAVARRAQQRVQAEDQVQAAAAAEGLQLVHRQFCPTDRTVRMGPCRDTCSTCRTHL